MKIKLTDIKKKWIKQTSLTVLLIFIIIAVYFEINILISKLSTGYIDVTSEKVYSISNETKERLKDISSEVKIQLVNFNNYSVNSTYADIENIINQYSNLNNNIKIEKTNDENISDYSIIITYNENQEEISIDDLYSYIFSTEMYAYKTINLCEEKITNAILNLINNDNKIYFYLTHSAYSSAYFSTIINDYYNINFITSKDNMEIPKNCKCLVIPTIIEDISENEKNEIISYINNGGKILLLQESKSLITEKMPNFKEVMNQYGFEISEGVVLESDSQNMIKNKPGYILADYNIDENTGNMCFIEPGTISMADDETLKNLGITYNVIAYSSKTAFLRKDMTVNDYTMTESDQKLEDGILGAEIIKKLSDGKESKIIVYSNSIFATDQSLSINDILNTSTLKIPAVSINDNETAIIRSINHLVNDNNNVLIRKNSMENIPTLQFLQNSIFVEMIFVLPMAIIIIGYIVWRIRKNKK